MDNLDLDRELQAALTVTPSPEFVARVRIKIAAAPPPSMLAGLLKPAAAIACVAVVAIVFGLREDARITPSAATAGLKPGTTNVPPSTTNVPPGTAAVQRPSVVPTSPPPPLQRFDESIVALAKAGRAAEAAAEPPLPEVIIAPGDIEALRQFVAGASELRFVASFDETPVSTPWVVTSLTIAPIRGDSLDPPPAHNN